MRPENISLYFRSGTSDKVYQLWLEPEPNSSLSWRVRFAYGRRGRTLRENYKIRTVPFSYARQVYDKFLMAKLAEGYQRGSDYSFGTPSDVPDVSRPVPDRELEEQIERAEAAAPSRFRPFDRLRSFEGRTTVYGSLPSCGYCGKPVRVYLPDGSKISDTRYCSNRCRELDAQREQEASKPRVERCPNCGRALYLTTNYPTYNDRRYCSQACIDAERRRNSLIFRKPKPKPKPVPRPEYVPPAPEDPYMAKPKRAITFEDE